MASTVPGCRTPHIWREDGSSLYDAMGPEFTLLRLDSGLDRVAQEVAALEATAHGKRVPLRVLDVKQPVTATSYDGRLGLSRPDQQQVAWRSERAPIDPADLIDRIRGAAD
ncbi:hypothetical protein [Bradyrhizobium sp.]|uniref:hypothetical protein n=1 Tax=Bradyrhizobium sp. TaxID=376 RepID=UPI003C4E9612